MIFIFVTKLRTYVSSSHETQRKLLPPNELDEVLPILLPGKIRHPLCPRLTLHPPQDPPYEQSWPVTSRPGPCRGPLGPNLEPSHLLVHVLITFYFL